MGQLHQITADVARHLLVAIDNAIPTGPAPTELQTLANAYAMVASHLPKPPHNPHTK